jgi:transcriptional regulator with XRE-family HTH domain
MNGRALLGWNLRRLRAQQGISQERLAADTGVDRAYVSELEREKAAATVDVIEKLAVALGVPLAELLAQPAPGAEEPRPLTRGRKPKAS